MSDLKSIQLFGSRSISAIVAHSSSTASLYAACHQSIRFVHVTSTADAKQAASKLQQCLKESSFNSGTGANWSLTFYIGVFQT